MRLRFVGLTLLAIALLAIALVGCGEDLGYDQVELIDVTGKVTLDGNPLAGAQVRFESADRAGAEGVTDAAGVYRLMYDNQTPGSTPGTKIVRITTAGAAEEGADPDNPTPGNTIPPQYNRESRLQADVSASNKSFDFDLKSQP